jgi:phosphoglucosamine mutase
MSALGIALAHRLTTPDNPQPTILLGMDTRESGPQIARALTAGIEAGGGVALFVGVIPTPAVAFLTRDSACAAGISISASHNPFEDNGVKVFGSDGMKLSDNIEKAIEDELLERRDTSADIAHVSLKGHPELIERYEDFLLSTVEPSALKGKRVVLDTGNGASAAIAADVFRRAGAEPIVINDRPDGRNINAGCGAMHPEKLAERVLAEKADFGVAFDGDADRAIFVDDRGNIRNGDEILYLWGHHEKERGTLRNNIIVATVMSNFGFEKKLKDEGITLIRAAVGDKYVLEQMIEHGAVLGGEQSGHIIDLRVHTTGDGLHTALAFGEMLAEQRRPFSELSTFEPLPQVLLNQKVASKPPLESLSGYQAAALDAETRLSGRGRILVRYSGTENLVRVMVEGDDDALINSIATQLTEALRSEIGA